jgi:hypothetical protein
MPILVAALTIALILLCGLYWNEREENALLLTKIAAAKAKARATASRQKPPTPAPADQYPPLRLELGLQTSKKTPVAERDEPWLKDDRHGLFVRRVWERVVQNRYAYLLQALGPLDAALVAKLKTLLVERELARQAAGRAAFTQGSAPNSAGYAQAGERATAEANRAIGALLGDKAAEFSRLDRLSAVVDTIESTFGGDLAFASMPLTHEQTLRLAETMFEVHYNPKDPEYRGRIKADVDPATGLLPLFREFLPKAAAVLSPEQLKVVRAYHAELVAGRGYRRAGSGPP